jgi:bacterioferritin
MTDEERLTRILNEAICLEYTAAIQYCQHSMLLCGRDRALFEEYFVKQSREALGHAKLWGERIVYLGGVPRCEVGHIHQSTDLNEMLAFDLDMEKKAREIYTRAHRICKDDPTRFMLENHIIEEDHDVETIQKFLGQVRIAKEAAQIEKEFAHANH